MFCTTCATYNPATLLRCDTCGASLHDATAPNGRAQHEPTPVPNGFLRMSLAIVPIIVVLLAAGIVVRDIRLERSTRANAYDRAQAAMEAGDYSAAIDAFAAAGDYRDAKNRHDEAEAAIAPYRAAYLAGVTAFDTGDYDLAITQLVSVVRDFPAYEDAAEIISQARSLRTDRLTTDLQTAEANRDWLQAEHLLNLLLTESPDDPTLQAQFVQLSRYHSPMVFSRNGGVYVVSPDLLDERLLTNEVNGIWPAWSPDRTKVAFYALIDDQSVNYGLYVIGVDGTGLARLAKDIHLAGWPVWSPDGTKIAFSSLTPFDLNGQSGITSLHTVDVGSGLETSYTTSLFMYATSPTWSPDGARIAFVSKKFLIGGPAVGSRSEGSIEVLDLETGLVTPVAESTLPFAQYVSWSPRTNQLLVLSSELGSAWYQTLISTIDVVDLDNGTVRPITKRSEIVSYPIWSPDGSHYAFAEGNHVIQIHSIDGAISWINLPRDISPFLTWSPDGSTLIAPALNSGQASLIVAIDATSSPVDLPLVFDYSDQLAGPPQWSAASPLLPKPLPSADTPTS